jgi:hypothetical protein
VGFVVVASFALSRSTRLLADDDSAGPNAASDSQVAPQAHIYQSVMTRPVGSDGFTLTPGERPQEATHDAAQTGPMLALNVDSGSPGQSGLLGDTIPATAGPAGNAAGPEAMSSPMQPAIPGGAEPTGPPQYEGPMDNPPPPHGGMFSGLHALFRPAPNGNWDNEPLHFDTFLGFIDDRTAQNTGVLGGFRLGWDYDTYWGVETRLGFTSLQEDTGPVVIWDESLLYYPWGDSRVRPYFTLGLGVNECRIVDPGDDWHHRQNLVDMPFGIGFKYRLHEWLVLRFDILDNLAFGSGSLGTMNNFSFTTGFEWRFGGVHYNYWPWNPAPAR